MSACGAASLRLVCLALALLPACAPPAPQLPTPVTPSLIPNMVQTAEAQLTASFATLTPTRTDTPIASPTVTQTLRVLETLRVSAASATVTSLFGASATPTVFTATPIPRPTQTVTVLETLKVSTATPTATQTPAVPLSPANAISVTQAAILGPVIVAGTRIAKLDQVAFAPDGQLAAAGAAGLLFDRAGALTVTAGYTVTTWATTLDFSPDGGSLAAGTVEGTVRIFNRARGTFVLQLVQPGSSVDQVRYQPGPSAGLQFIASLGSDNRVYLWDILQPRSLGTLDIGLGSAQVIEFSGDGRWLAAASGPEVRVWPVDALTTGQALLPGSAPAPALSLQQSGNVTSLALSRDGRLLAAGNATGAIELWDLPGGLAAGNRGQFGAPAQHLAFSPDGRLLASSHGDRRIRLWALAGAGTLPLANLRGHTDAITSLAFSPDGTTLASSSWDGTVRLWAAPTQ